MRKIEEKMIDAIENRENFKLDNTRVVINGLGGYLCDVYLHGKPIFSIERNKVKLTVAGWNTPTTRSRLNAIGILYGFTISKSKDILYLKTKGSKIIIDENNWYNLKGDIIC